MTGKIKTNASIYIPLPDTQLPSWVSMKPIEHPDRIIENAHIPSNGSFSDRNIWIYKPNDFDPIDGKIVFMLDGEHFCKTLTSYIDAMRQKKENNQFSNTAFVFVNSGKYESGLPGRVLEYYIKSEEFGKYLADVIIPECSSKLAINNKNNNNIILASHSLAVYPMLEIANNHPNKINGLLLLSPEILCSKKLPLSEQTLSAPIYMQVGNLEDAIPPVILQGVNGDKSEHKLNKSRLVANTEFHADLVKERFNVGKLNVHSSGHSEIHVIDGMVKGLQFVHNANARLSQKSTTKIAAAISSMRPI